MTRDDEARWARQDEIERRYFIEAANISIQYFSRFTERGDERHRANILDKDGMTLADFDWTDDLEALMSRARTRRDTLAEEFAKAHVSAVELEGARGW